MLMRKVLFGALAASFLGGAAQASTLVIESFDDFPNANNVDMFTSQGFNYDPLGTVVGQCFEAICLREDEPNTSPLITTITRVDDDNEPTGETYDFLGFYLNFNGLTADSRENFFDVFADDEAEARLSLTLSDSFDTLGITVFEVSNQGVVSDSALDGDGLFTFDNVGYFILLDDLFLDVASITLSSDSQGTARFDCAAYGVPGGGTTSLSIGQLSQCDFEDPQAEIPLPGSLPLLAGALGLTAVIRRRKGKN